MTQVTLQAVVVVVVIQVVTV